MKTQRIHFKTSFSLAVLALLGACAGPGSEAEQEWTSLFNGEDFSGWHAYGGGNVGDAWVVTPGGAMHLRTAATGRPEGAKAGDVITDDAFGNYEFELEWKIGACGNSGIIYNVFESEEFNAPWRTGAEMQVLDDDCHPDGKIKTHRSGDLYDIMSIAEENVRPVGEWNSVRLVVTEGRVEHWMNGVKQLEYSNVGEEWGEMIANSKFKNFPGWGLRTSGQISLQDHGDPVWYRNIRVRQL